MMSHEVGDVKNMGKSFPKSTWTSTIISIVIPGV